MSEEAPGRTLQTACSVLKVLKMLASSPNGIRSQDVATNLDKSASTAVYLLNSLCGEGFAERDDDGHYRLITTEEPEADPAALPFEDLNKATDELYGRTNERSYLATIQDHRIVLHDSRGRQGLPIVPGIGSHIGREAHALALGKAILAFSEPAVVDRYQQVYGLTRFTSRTIIDPLRLREELGEIRMRGFAVDEEEFAEGFCCIAAPVTDHLDDLCGALGLSMTPTRFDQRGATFGPMVVAIARAARNGGLPPSWEPLSSSRRHRARQRLARLRTARTRMHHVPTSPLS